jgi:hypothetical protein
MRARAVAQDLSTRGLGWPGADQAKAISEILKGYGGLTETAMLGATALGLLITAAVLAWHLPTSSTVNKKPQARLLGQLAITVTNKRCATSFKTVNGRQALAAKKPGRYRIAIKDQSSKTGFALTGASIDIASPAAARGVLTLRRNLAKGTYRLVCRPAGKKSTTLTFKIS